VVSINLITGQQNTVLTLTETDKFGSFETRDCSLFIKIFDKFIVSSTETETLVDPLKIHETRESFLQDGGIIWENLLENVLKQQQLKKIFKNVLENLLEKNVKCS
jgi:hypothetical protein